MRLWTIVGVLLAVTAALSGIAVALGVASLPGDWSRVGVVLSLIAVWVLWELLLRVRERAYDAEAPPTPSPAASRMAIAISVLIGLAVVIAVALGWLNV